MSKAPPDFEGIEAEIRRIQSKLDALGPYDRSVGIDRLRGIFEKYGIKLDERDLGVLEKWARHELTSQELVAHFGPKWREIDRRHSMN